MPKSEGRRKKEGKKEGRKREDFSHSPTLPRPFPLRSDFSRMPSIVVARDRTMEMWLCDSFSRNE
ncbi:hypothetical protein QUB70_32675 [Microcoleus sp. A003_D6]|uniref:hypothetical protein n=1 Tax=Microcoleus sp. A003_D6 TaxID=3055266 RepID=UPI002FCF9390